MPKGALSSLRSILTALYDRDARFDLNLAVKELLLKLVSWSATEADAAELVALVDEIIRGPGQRVGRPREYEQLHRHRAHGSHGQATLKAKLGL